MWNDQQYIRVTHTCTRTHMHVLLLMYSFYFPAPRRKWKMAKKLKKNMNGIDVFFFKVYFKIKCALLLLATKADCDSSACVR